MGIIIELQREALDESISIESLMRKAYLVAKKLNLKEFEEWLNENSDNLPTKFEFFSSKSELYRILSTVRNKILDWALLLEENGIVGDGMTFTEVEKQTAQSTQVINNYTNNFYGTITDIEVEQG